MLQQCQGTARALGEPAALDGWCTCRLRAAKLGPSRLSAFLATSRVSVELLARCSFSLRAGVAFLAEHGSEGACASDEDEHGASASDEDDRSPHRPRRVASDEDAPCPLCLNVPLPYRQSMSSAPP